MTTLAVPELSGQLALPGLEVSPVGARLVDLASLSPDAIVDALRALRRADSATRFLTGDLVQAHMAATGDPAESLATIVPLGFDQAALSNAATLAVAVPHEVRRESLTWSHHWAVRRLPVDQQRDLLLAAEGNGWSARDLERRAQAIHDEANPPLPGMARLPRPPESALRRALAASDVVLWVPGADDRPGGLSAARVLHRERRGEVLVAVVELDPALDVVLGDEDGEAAA